MKFELDSCKNCPLREQCLTDSQFYNVLCQKALSEAIGVKYSQSLSKTLKHADNLLEVFIIPQPSRRYPRKFIRLKPEVQVSHWLIESAENEAYALSH
ncbi:hypothetical protein TBCH5v1_0044 [Thermococcus barophilus]|uniref:Uncharacterized protein n=1 Tax=Thermococcus barophilus TaxID=55802 RepID=A0A0S1X8D7_THEBA|nr:hypothetical protein TBCH5v1_0044 [Thermococcus barophilus]